MLGFLGWLRSSTKIKRWIIMIFIGAMFLSYGFSNIIKFEELSGSKLAEIIITFVIGFTIMMIGLIFYGRRNLELLIEASNKEHTDENTKKIDIKSLIFKRKVYDEGPKIVVIGGGLGVNNLLKGLKKYTNNLTLVTTSNTDELTQNIIALAKDEQIMSIMMRDSSFSGMYFKSIQNIFGDYSDSISKTKDILNITGRIIPVTSDDFQVGAELKNGTTVYETNKIAENVSDKVTQIDRVFIAPSNCRTSSLALEAIDTADAIIIGPGSLYTKTIPNLLMKYVTKTIKESKAIKVFVNNIMTEPGHTDNYSLFDHVETLINHTEKNIIDYCICDTGEIVPEIARRYNMDGADIIEKDISKIRGLGINVLQKDLSFVENNQVSHDPDKLAIEIINLICDDLKFKDKQNDSQFVLLNSKLKEQKKKVNIAPKRQKEIIKAKREKRPTSKFGEKYSKRIDEIKNSDKKRIENIKFMEKAEKFDKK